MLFFLLICLVFLLNILAMPLTKTDMIAQLQKEILHLQGYRSARHSEATPPDLGPVNKAFPHNIFPCAAIHEFLCSSAEQTAATAGFISALLGRLAQQNGICLWISAGRTIFPGALALFGIAPDRIIFADLEKEKDVLWAMEEALKCPGLAAVIAEVKQLSFTQSRRLQLATEQSRVTGLVIGQVAQTIASWQNTACAARWQITPLPSQTPDQLPGVGFPRWQVTLLKVRNGRPGSWTLEWASGNFVPVTPNTNTETLQRRAG